MSQEVGTFALVLHSHLPWLAHHGRWPVGEEWLYQAWAHAYLPVATVLRELAEEGRTDLLTLGVTPVLAAQLDDPHTLRGMHTWLGDWQLRAHQAGGQLGSYEHRRSDEAMAEFEAHWRHGGSPVLRHLAHSGAVELLGGPLAHPFAPLLHPRLREFSLEQGLRDGEQRWGTRPAGLWAPECAYAPGMERGYTDAGVQRFVVDGPALHGRTAAAHPVGASNVLAFGRDLTVSYRVWSPRTGYPGSPEYRDFHAYDHDTGLKASRVTGRHVAAADKAPYDPVRAAGAVARDAAAFVTVVRRRLEDLARTENRPGLVVAAFDTELFGHWWHEGPAWLAAVLRQLPAAGVRVSTLRGAVDAGHVGAPVELGPTSWGSGKDWRVWEGEGVRDLVELNADVVNTALAAVDRLTCRPGRNPVADQLLREALLTVSSDWAFMVTKDSAADYARTRARTHAHAVYEIARAVTTGSSHAITTGSSHAADLAARWRLADGPFPALDARLLPA